MSGKDASTLRHEALMSQALWNPAEAACNMPRCCSSPCNAAVAISIIPKPL